MNTTEYTFRTRCNGYDDGHRLAAWATGTGRHHQPEPTDAPLTESFVLSGYGQDLKDDAKAVYLWDDGTRVLPLYVAGWTSTELILKPLPLSVGTRPDGRPVDMSGWALTPTRVYHLKVTRAVVVPADPNT